MRGLTITLALICAAPASADEVVLRLSGIAPDGTAWARELKALSRDVETATGGAVRMRWYLGGIAGDEKTALDRIRRGQLDGFAGASSCLELAPTMKVARVIGLVHSRAEGLYLLNQLRRDIDDELKKSGFVDLGLGGFGLDLFFLRAPVRSLAEARRLPIWVWNVDDVVRDQMSAMGFHLVPAEVDRLSDLYDQGQIDGMFVVPTAALAFQWTARAKYFLDLNASYLPGCIVVAQRAFDLLSFDQQQAVRAAANKFARRFEESGLRDDTLLLTSLLERQGLKHLKPSDAFRDELLSAAVEARARIPAGRLPPGLVARAIAILGELRGEHP